MFNLGLAREARSVIVRLTGELDIENAPDVKDCLGRLVEQGDADIVVDLRQLTFCDSSGVSALVYGYEACRAADGRLRIRGENGTVARVLDISGVRGVLSGSGTSPTR